MMTGKKEEEELLIKMGLTKHEASAYAALWDSNPKTASEIASKVEIQKPRIYDVLKNMEQKGLIHTQDGKPTKYIPVPPQHLVNNINKAREKNKEQKINACDDLMTAMDPIYLRAIPPKELSYMITGKKNVVEAAIKMMTSAKRISFIAACKPEKCMLCKNTIKKITGRVRLVSPRTHENSQNLEVKVSPIKGEVGMLIADEKETLLMVKKKGACECEKALHIKNPAMSAGFEQFFDFMWKSL